MEKNTAQALTAEEIATFRSLFGKYCSYEIYSGRCDAGCEGCRINHAIMEIFDGLDYADEE